MISIAADLHMHTYYSDGAFSPYELANMALKSGCNVVALTDHDTVSGVSEFTKAAALLGIKNIAGIEISAFDGVEAHILGYNIDYSAAPFMSYVKELELSRRERSKNLLLKLKSHKIDIPEDYFKEKVFNELSRTHMADAIVQLNYERDAETAFKKWLKEGAPTYVPMQGRSAKEAIEKILEAGGTAVLAHPMRLKLDHFDRISFIKKLKKYGLGGIEAVYKHSSQATVKNFKQIADDLGLFVTCGADFHRAGNEILPRTLSKSARIALKLDEYI